MEMKLTRGQYFSDRASRKCVQLARPASAVLDQG